MTKLSNTLGTLSDADAVFEVVDKPSARDAIERAGEQGLVILGGASNVILRRWLRQPVALVKSRGIKLLSRAESEARVWSAGGESWHDLVMWCLANDVPGLENLALIPGTVGAAPIQNIGAYGVEVAEFIEVVEAIRLNDGVEVELSPEECGFTYRDSVFKRESAFFITGLRLRFNLQRPLTTSYPHVSEQLIHATPRGVAETVMDIRRAKLPDPADVGNVGSFFKNPVVSLADVERLRGRVDNLVVHNFGSEFKLAAAQLIDQAGWRGEVRYGVEVWPRQPLVLVNRGARLAADFLRLASEIAEDVQNRFEVRLEIEPVVLGED